MKKTLLLSVLALSLSAGMAMAQDSKDSANAEVTKDVSHNALTGNTTTTVTKKHKKKLHSKAGGVSNTNAAEDTTKTEKKVSDDGTKTSVKTESTHTETNK